MKTEDKELLLKDLCARLPYGVMVQLVYDENTTEKREMGLGSLHDIMVDNAEGKPYLRPMSSMTEEEEDKYMAINCYEGLFPRYEDALDYILSHHFDFRDLIPMGLALEAPEDMYKTE